jgi:hypothetical protein
MNRHWTEWPIAAVSLNPIRGEQRDYYAFCDICVVLHHPTGIRETVVDCRTRCLTRWGEHKCIGDFTSLETERFDLVGWRYLQAAREVRGVLETICFGVKGALPMAVNPALCRKLLYKAVRLEEGPKRDLFDKDGVFMLRERSRWLDLGRWRRAMPQAEPFSGLKATPLVRVHEALDRLPIYSAALGTDPFSTVSELLDWQERLPP